MIVSVLLVCIGLVGLWLSGELVVRYSLQLAYLAGISTLLIGFFFISISTGLPEFFVVLQATWLNEPSLAVGDIMGSNFFDLVLAVGLPVLLVRPILIHKDEYAQTIGLLLGTLILMIFIFANQQLHTWHGIVMIGLYIGINLMLFKIDRTHMSGHNLSMVKETLSSEYILTGIGGTGIKLFGAIIGVLISAHLTVSYAVLVAQQLGLPIALFGATFVALGTSLPELTLSMTALKNKEYTLALGNVFGSIWNQGAVGLGLAAILNKSVPLSTIWHIIPFALFALGIIAFCIIVKREIARTAGILLISTYTAFIFYEFLAFYGYIA